MKVIISIKNKVNKLKARYIFCLKLFCNMEKILIWSMIWFADGRSLGVKDLER